MNDNKMVTLCCLFICLFLEITLRGCQQMINRNECIVTTKSPECMHELK